MRASTIYLFCLFIGCALAALNSNWRLAWSDEFDTLDKTKWNIRDKAGNYGNGEKQWYHPNQTTVSNGKLVLTAIKKTWGGQTYLSGLVDSMDKAFFTYGRYEVRVKMPAGKGLWPAMWLLSNTKCWGAGGEVDIAEFRGSYKTTIGNFYHYSSQCCAGFSNCISSKGSGKDLNGIISSPDLTAGYHTYALEWFPENMTWYVDNVKTNSYKTRDLVVSPQDASPHYWILNSAVGGSYPGNPDSTTPFPNYVYIDYVRNYVWRTTCTGETCSNHGCCNSAKLCVCDDGWAGAKCEQWIGSITNKYDSIIHNLDNVPNGWGNDYTMYLTKNTVISSGALKFTLTSSGCPTSCGNKAWSSGAWEFTPRYTYGTYTFKAKGPYVNGTGLSMGAAGEDYTSLEQIAFSILGNAPNIVEFRTWKTGFMWIHMRLDMGVDLSKAWHTYSFEYAPTYVVWYVDGVKRYNSTEVTPSGKLAMGVYYTAQPEWYGPFTYTEPSYVYLDETSWTQTLSKKGQC